MSWIELGLLLADLLAPGAPDFRSDVQATNKVYGPIRAASEALLLEGKVAEANQAFLDAVPQEKRTAAHWFVLGNILYGIDFDLSYRLHAKAYELAPEEPMVAYELALQRHRRGEHAEAEPLYAKAASVLAKSAGFRALHADCLLRLGRLEEAVAEWEAADLRNEHIAVEKSFCWIYGEPHPITRRGELLAKARAGDVEAAEDLLLLDLHWRTDWWNSGPNREYVEHDLEVVRKALAKAPERLAAVEFLVKLTPDDELDGGVDPSEVAAAAKALGVVGDAPKLPERSAVATRVLDQVVRSSGASPVELLVAFEAELERRIQAGDAVALEILAALYEETKSPKIAAIEKYGWEELADANCVAGLLARSAATRKSNDKVLAAALAKYPQDARITEVALEIAHREKKDERAALVRHLEALLTDLTTSMPARAAFRALAEDLAKPR